MFQSTRPVWGATLFRVPPHARMDQFQSTRPVWGATGVQRRPCGSWSVSIHAPRVGRDDQKVDCSILVSSFQSTRPVWGATQARFDQAMAFLFQSTRPVWGATLPCWPLRRTILFQSTRPVWGATRARSAPLHLILVSIHAPRVGRD